MLSFKLNSFIKFCIIGVFNTGLNYSVFYLLTLLKCPTLLAGSIGFISGAVSGFILNRRFTFSSQVDFASGMGKYLLIQALGLTVHFMVQYFCLFVLLFPKLLSQLPGIVFTTFINYFLSKKFVFKS